MFSQADSNNRFIARVRQLKHPWPSVVAWIVCLTGTIFYGYEYILRVEPSIMQDQLRSYFNITSAGSWGGIVGLYYLSYTPMQVPAGPITDHWGPRRVLTLALALCVSGLWLFYAFPNVYLAAVGRLLVGFGSAFAYIGASRLAVIWLPARRFALFTGFLIGTGMLGAISGNMLLSGMVHSLGWRSVLNITLMLGIFLLPVILITAEDNYGQKSNRPPFDIRLILKRLRQVFSYSQVWLAGLIACFLYVAVSGFGELWGPVTLQYVYGFSAKRAATLNSAVFWGALFGAPFAGWLSDFWCNRKIPLVSACIICCAIISTLIYMPIHNAAYVTTLLFFYGFFAGFEIIAYALGREYIGAHIAGTAIAFVNMLTMMSGLIYQPLIGFILDLTGKTTINHGDQAYTALSYQEALSVIPFSLVIAALICIFWLKETHAIPIEEMQKEKSHH